MTDFRLHTFLAVCREKSFTRAAETLHITQPAVTQHIKYLESDLGHALLVTAGRNVTLTREGSILLRFAETVESDARRTRERIVSGGVRRTLRFGATRTIGEFVMPSYIAGWVHEFPETDISMQVDNSETLFRALHRGELDFLFVEGMFDRDSYAVDLLFCDSFIPICAPDHPLSIEPCNFSDILGETLIVRETGSGSRKIIEQAFSSENRSTSSFAHVLEIGNIGAMKTLVSNGIGISFLYGSSVKREILDGTLAQIRINRFNISHDFSFVCLKNSLYEGEYRLFLDYCRQQLYNT